MSQTKRSLVLSCLSILLCVSMLIGSTFAWFMDNTFASVNSIQTGILDIQLLKADGTSAEGEPLTFVDKDADSCWEPGCTYNLETVTVKNNGNLDLKYKIILSGIAGSAKLNEVIDWTLKVNGSSINADDEFCLSAGEGNTIAISGHMRESAHNDYQGLMIEDIAITVIATQNTIEKDSEDEFYDADATYAAADDAGKIENPEGSSDHY